MLRKKLTLAQRRWLDQELLLWQEDASISREQAEQILGRYETADQISEQTRSGVVQTLLGLAAFLFGLAALLLIGFNWDQMARDVKLAIVLAVVGATHFCAFVLRRQGKHLALSEAVAFLGCMLYGAGIWLVAQAFHLEAHYPDGVWWWAIGVLPFALCLDSLLLHVLFVGLVALWGGMEVIGFHHLSPWWWGFGRFNIPNGAYSLPLLAAPGLAWAYYRKSTIAIALYVPLLAWWAVLQAFALRLDLRSIFWIGNVGAILILFAEAHRARDPRGVPFRLWGVLLVSGVLLTLGSLGFWNLTGMRRGGWYTERYVAAMITEVIASLILVSVSIGILVLFRGLGAIDLKGETSDMDTARRRWFALTLVASLMFMAVWSLSISESSVASGLPIVVANLVTVGMALYLVKVGEQEERTRPFAAGVMMLLTWAIVRYIDLFGAAGGMIGAAVVFALCGGGLVLVANFWNRKRQSLSVQTNTTEKEFPIENPHLLNASIAWLKQNRTTILIGSAIAQVLFLVGMIVVESLPLMIGKRIMLTVTPIDPRDFFRGDYVILNYDFNRLSVPELNVANVVRSGSDLEAHMDKPVYVALEKESGRNYWKAINASLSKPSDGIYLRGRVSGDYRQPLMFGIEAYYVQEGEGKVLEQLRNSNQLSAEVAVAPWGQAKLVRLIEK